MWIKVKNLCVNNRHFDFEFLQHLGLLLTCSQHVDDLSGINVPEGDFWLNTMMLFLPWMMLQLLISTNQMNLNLNINIKASKSWKTNITISEELKSSPILWTQTNSSFHHQTLPKISSVINIIPFWNVDSMLNTMPWAPPISEDILTNSSPSSKFIIFCASDFGFSGPFTEILSWQWPVPSSGRINGSFFDLGHVQDMFFLCPRTVLEKRPQAKSCLRTYVLSFHS